MAYVEPSKKVKMEFTSIPPGGSGGTTTTFDPAFIQNLQFSYNPQWGTHMDMGRGDPKVMYNQYQASITVSWWVVALQSGDVSSNITKLNQISDMTNPKYNGDFGFNGVYCKMTIANLVEDYGYISSFSYSIDEETPWDSSAEKPLYFNCDLTLNLIRKTRPSYGGLGHLKV